MRGSIPVRGGDAAWGRHARKQQTLRHSRPPEPAVDGLPVRSAGAATRANELGKVLRAQ